MSGKTHFKKGGKWNEQRTIVAKESRTSPDGIVHRTRAECNRWCKLRLLESQGIVRNLRREVKFKLVMEYAPLNGQVLSRTLQIKSRKGNIRSYTADFVYETKMSDEWVRVHGYLLGDGWHEIIEDIKGFLEPAQELRLDVFEALYERRVYINKV